MSGMTWQGGVLIFGPLFVELFNQAVAVLGLVWMPCAALICALTARSRGLSVTRYAIAGAVYSILLSLPWIYLWFRMRNRPLPFFIIVAGYVFLYVTWIFAHLSVMIFFATALGHRTGIALAWTVSLLLVFSLAHLVIHHKTRAHTKPNSIDELEDNLLIPWAAIGPFVYKYIGMVLYVMGFYTISPFVAS